MVVRVSGRRRPAFCSADVTRSSDSFTAASGSPTSQSPNSPISPELTSTSTGKASTPTSAPERMTESILSAMPSTTDASSRDA